MSGGWRYGSGRPRRRQRAEDTIRLDVRHMERSGHIRPGLRVPYFWKRGTEPAGDIVVHTHDGGIELVYRYRQNDDDWRPMRIAVPLTSTPCTFGGERHWFHCPICNRRCALLYIHAVAGCRACMDVGYASQAETPLDRLRRRSDKLELLLRGDDRRRWRRPPGMHHRTYRRIIDQLVHMEMRWDDLFEQHAANLLREPSGRSR